MLLSVFNTGRQSVGCVCLCCQHIHNIRSIDGAAINDCDSQFTPSLDAPSFP